MTHSDDGAVLGRRGAEREDDAPDGEFHRPERMVAHIDEAAIAEATAQACRNHDVLYFDTFVDVL